MPLYFNPGTDAALKAFIESKTSDEKSKIFDLSIRPAFEKLIENHVYLYHFFNLGDTDALRRECLTNLYEMIPKFKPEMGTKGFSYFNVIVKNWFIQKSRENNKRNKTESELYLDLDHETAKSDPNFSVSPYEDLVQEKERWLCFYEEMETWKDKLSKKTERQVLDAVIFLMRHPEFVSIYNKKAVYLYLRELTGLNTKQVVVNLKKVKQMYEKWKDRWDQGEE